MRYTNVCFFSLLPDTDVQHLVRIPPFSSWFSVWWHIPTSAFFHSYQIRMYNTCRCTINSTAVSLFVYSLVGGGTHDTYVPPVDAHVWRQLHVSAVARCSDSYCIFIFYLGIWRGRKRAKPLRTEPSSWRSLTPPGTEIYLNFVYYDTTTYPICRRAPVTHTTASHLCRAAPTAYGAAEMASPPNGSDSSSCSSSHGSSDGDSTSPAIILPYLDAETTLVRGGRWLPFLWRKQNQLILPETSFNNQKPQQLIVHISYPHISGSSKLEK